MNTETLARLISGADHLSFRDLALEYLASRGYKEVTSTDGWSDGGTDVRVFTQPPIPDPVAFQVTVEWDWKKKLYEDAEKVKRQLGLSHLTLIASRRIPEAEFLDAADDVLLRFQVRVGRVDCQAMASKFFLENKTTRVLELLGIPTSSEPAAQLLTTPRAEAAYAFVFFGKETGRFRDAVAEAAIISVTGPRGQAQSRRSIEAAAAAALSLKAEESSLIAGAFDRLMQRQELLQEGDADAYRVNDAVADAQEAMRKLRTAEWSDLQAKVKAAVRAATGTKRASQFETQAITSVCENLGAVLLDSAHRTVVELHGEDPVNVTERNVRPKLQALHASLDALGAPEGDARNTLLFQLTGIAEASALGQFMVSGELFVSLMHGRVPSFVRALGARDRVAVVLDASVAIPMLCSLYFRPARNRFSLSAYRVYREVRGAGMAAVLPDEYLEEVAAHLVNAARDYPSLAEIDPDLVESDNAFVAHYASLRVAGELADGFTHYLAAFGLDAGLAIANFTVARDVMASRLRTLFERYGIDCRRLPFASRAARKTAEEAVGFAMHEQEIDRPRVVVEHDVRVLAFLGDASTGGGAAHVLCTWDNLHFVIRSRVQAEWLAVDPSSLADLLALTSQENAPSVHGASVLAMALSDAAARRGAEVLDRLVRIERGNLHDADLLRTAREFKANYVKRVVKGERVAPIARAWAEWKGTVGKRGPASRIPPSA
jgi:hypothetical protein